MLALGHHHGGGPQDDPDVEDDRGFVGPRHRLVEAEARRDLNHEDDEQGKKKTTPHCVGGLLQQANHNLICAYFVALMRSSKPLLQTLAYSEF